MHESKRVKELMDNNLDIDASILLEPNLKSATTSSVGKLSIAAPASWHDVDIVVLVCPGHKPETEICQRT